MVPKTGRADEVQRAAGLQKMPLDGFAGKADRNGARIRLRRPRGGLRPISMMLSAMLSASGEVATRDGIHLTVTGEPK